MSMVLLVSPEKVKAQDVVVCCLAVRVEQLLDLQTRGCYVPEQSVIETRTEGWYFEERGETT